MCLLTNNKPQIADSDIKVKKLVERPLAADFGKDEADYVSWYMGFPYKRGRVYRTEIQISDDNTAFDRRSRVYYENHEHVSYKEGFHSIRPGRHCDNDGYGYGVIKVNAIIPAGATYITDNTGLYISDSIIILL